MLMVTAFSVATRAVFLAVFHHELMVFFSVSSQVSWANAIGEAVAKQTAATAHTASPFVLVIGFLHSSTKIVLEAGQPVVTPV